MEKKVLGFRVDLIGFEGALECAAEAAQKRENLHIVTINPEMIMLAKKNPEFARILNEAELVIPDGVGIKLALKFKGIAAEQIRGVDFSRKLIELAAKKSPRVALLGAKEDVLCKTRAVLQNEFNNLDIVYARNGYFESDKAIDETLNKITETDPQVVLVALGAPKQEIIISKLKALFAKKGTGAVMIGVGGTFDVLSGTVKQAPVIWQKLGLEWLYRTIKQPERLGRIFPTLPLFLFQSIMESVREPRS